MESVLILAGGNSSEREVSLRSGVAIAGALRQAGYKVLEFDPADGLENLPVADVVFPALHGKEGEDGVIQAALEARGLPYVGSDSKVSALCFDKQTCKQLLQAHDIDVPRGELVNSETIWKSPLATQPFVLKPLDGGSSIDTFIVRTAGSYDKTAIEQALTRHKQMLIEELISGIELTVGILSDMALPVVEIIPPEGGEFDYDNKYNGQAKELCPPLHISPALQRTAQQLALQAHTIAGCRDFSRVDMILAPGKKFITLEINTIPGMTKQSLFPIAATEAGLGMTTLCDKLVRMALSRA